MNMLIRSFVATLGLAVLVSPSLALADDQSAPPAAMQARHAEFAQFHEKMAALHAQARSQVLATLTPAHKAEVGNIIGALAVAQNPNPDGAARQIDALLSPGERNEILRIHETVRTQMHSMMESMHAQMEQAGAQGGPGHEMHEMPPHPESQQAPDAGHILLMLSAHPEPHMMMAPR